MLIKKTITAWVVFVLIGLVTCGLLMQIGNLLYIPGL